MRYGQTRCVKSHRARVVQIKTPKLLGDNTVLVRKKGRFGRDSQLHPGVGTVVAYVIYMTSMGEEIETSMYPVARSS
jgi:hypothetical protein